MSKLLNKRPLGYTEARYAEYDNKKIVLDVACFENIENCKFVLYNPQTTQVCECKCTANAILVDSICTRINTDTEWMVCIQYTYNNEERLEFLRYLECKITKEQEVEMYDKRELYGKPIVTEKGEVLLLAYGINGNLNIEKYDNEKYIYMSQIKNEVSYVNATSEEKNKNYLVSVKCKKVQGNYVGLIAYEDTKYNQFQTIW